MGSYYQCSDPDSNEKNWTGHIRPLNINRNEFEVTARGSTFHLLICDMGANLISDKLRNQQQ